MSVRPSTPAAFVTTGVPAQNASMTLFFMPEPEDIGSTATAARCSSSAMVGTGPTTVTPGRSASRRTAAAGRAPAILRTASGTCSRTRGRTSEATKRAGPTLWK
jgi:hypothetical protein